ncbi:tail fiber/spike domain-containing protein, partial [Citrobacter portucalensis]|uniref:tail fiber/spike domain-containing protein n=1 Tax=Citrobacter portucalensis TaxID=1639133 RepID=UPI00396B08A7
MVPANSTPESTGGIGPGAWINVGDTALRSELQSGDGSLVNTRYGTLAEYVEKTPSLLATKYMDETEMA